MEKQAYEVEVVETNASAVAVANDALTPNLIGRFVAFLDAKPRTVDAYAKSLKPFYSFSARKGITSLRGITRSVLIEYRDDLKARLKPSTVQMYVTALRLFVRWLSQEGMMANVADHLKGAKTNREHKKDYLAIEQANTVLDSVDRSTVAGKRDYAILLCGIGGGLRTVEMSRANVEDLRTVGEGTALFLQGKGRDEKAEFLMLADEVVSAIRDYLSARGAVKGDEPLFASVSHRGVGARLSTRSLSWIVKENLKAAGFNSSRLTAHSLRHTFGTQALRAGMPIEQVQQALRHKQITTTMIYAHQLGMERNTCSSAVAAALFGKKAG